MPCKSSSEINAEYSGKTDHQFMSRGVAAATAATTTFMSNSKNGNRIDYCEKNYPVRTIKRKI